MMTYNQEILKKIKDLKERIDNCSDPYESVILQSQLVEILKETLTDPKFKEGIIKKF